MERKFKVNNPAAGDSPANEAHSKEVALEKLRKMEWKRNTQDPWHLARPNSRGNDTQERKKNNKEEDSYFEGTGVQKTKKLRRPRLPEAAPTAPPGFSIAPAAPAPQVNAWTKKKGSALFHKEDEIDEDDQVMKLVLEESLKSMEEDEKRRLERLRMTNLDLPTVSETACAEKVWEEKFSEEKFHSKQSPDDFQDSTQAELHFVETDVRDEKPTANQRHRSIPPRSRKISPQEKSTTTSPNQKFDHTEAIGKLASSNANRNTHPMGEKTASSHSHFNEVEDDEYFEPSRPHLKYSKAVDKVKDTASSSTTNVTKSSSNVLPKSSVKHDNISEDLATGFDSALTFGDTQGLFKQIQEDNELKLRGSTQNFQTETRSCSAASNSSEKKFTDPSEPSETDILLHSFIRHEPPSNVNYANSNLLDMSSLKQSESSDFFTQATSPPFSSQNLNTAQSYGSLPTANDQIPVVNGLMASALTGGIQIPNDQNTNSSLSGSPLQNMTPFGSLEKELPSNVKPGMPLPTQIGNIPFPYPYSLEQQDNLARQLQTMQLLNQSLPMSVNNASIASHVRNMMTVNPQSGQPQYGLPNSNLMFPPYQGHISPLVMQQQLQQAQVQPVQMPPVYMSQMSQMLALEAARLQQSQSTTGAAETNENSTEEQANPNQAQIQNANLLLAQSLGQTSQAQIPHSQILPQVPQPQASQAPIPSQTLQNPLLSQAQAQLLQQNKAQMMLQNQQHFMHLQNHPLMASMQNPLQTVPTGETPNPKQEELLHQHSLLEGRTQQGIKTKEEIMLEYQNTLLALNRITQEMQEAQVQPTTPVAPLQPSWGGVPPSPSVPMVSQFFPLGLVSQAQPQVMQLPQNSGLISASLQPGSVNMEPEINTQEQNKTSVGRGRGRLH